MKRVRLIGVADLLAETVVEIVESPDFNRWVTYDDNSNPIKLEVLSIDLYENEEDKVVISWPFRLLDMSINITYLKSAGEFNISKVRLIGPKAATQNNFTEQGEINE